MSHIPFLNNIEVSGYLKILAASGYLDLDKNELRNAVIQNLGTEPASPSEGQAIYNTVNNHFGYWNGTAWIYPGENSDQLDGQHGSYYLNRANHTGTQTASTISNFDEASQDSVGGILTDTNSIDMTYDDANNQIKADVKIVSGGGIEIQATGIQLTATGVGAGTYTKVTVDAKGRITTATNLSSGDLPSHTHTASDITDFDTQVRTNRLDQMAAPTASVSMGSQKITNLAEPTASSDAATKNYVDSAVAGLKWKTSVKAATTTNITLSGTQTIDGVSVVAGDRVLVKNQSTASANGIYIVASGAWSRATDADAWAELVSSAVFVEQGTTQADSAWTCTSDAGGTLGTTAVSWSIFVGTSVYTASLGVQKVGNDFRAAYDSNSLELNGNNLRVKVDTTKGIERTTGGLAAKVDGTMIVLSGGNITLASAYRTRKHAADITGNGVLTEFTVTHSFNTRDITVDVWDNDSHVLAYPEVVADTVNQVVIKFSVAPAMSKVYRIVVVG